MKISCPGWWLLTCNHRPLLTGVLFCLKNGAHWIFGLVDNSNTCWVTPGPFGLEALTPLEAFKMIMKIIMLWVSYIFSLSLSTRCYLDKNS